MVIARSPPKHTRNVQLPIRRAAAAAEQANRNLLATTRGRRNATSNPIRTLWNAYHQDPTNPLGLENPQVRNNQEENAFDPLDPEHLQDLEELQLGENQMDNIQQMLQDLTIGHAATQRIVRAQQGLRPTFDEKDSFKSFARRLNDYMNAHGYDDADAIRLLPSLLLTETARDAYDKVDAALRTNGPWDRLVDALQAELYTPDKKLLAQSALSGVTQGTTETVVSFAKRCNELANRAYPTAQETATRGGFLFSAFLNGLKPKIRKEVRRKAPANFDAAKVAAISEEVLSGIEEKEEQSVKEAINNLRAEVHHLRLESYRYRSPDRRRSYSRDRDYSRDRRYYRDRSSSSDSYDNDRNNRKYRKGGNNDDTRRNKGRNNKGDRNNANNRNNNGKQSNSRNEDDDNNFQVNAIFDPLTAPADNTMGKRRKVNSINTSFLFVCALSCLIIPATALTNTETTFYACDNTRGGVLVAPPRPAECKPPPVKVAIRTTVEVFARNSTMEEFTAWRCSKEIYSQCTWTNFWINSYNQTLTKVEPASVEECQDAVIERQWKGQPLLQVDNGIYKTEMPNHFPSAGFWSAACNTSHRFVLEKGSMGSLSDNTIISSLMLNTEGCKVEKGSCAQNQTTIVWTPPPPVKDCSYITLGVYEAIIGGDSVIVEAAQGAFVLDHAPLPYAVLRCFKTHAFLTTSGTLLTFPELTNTTDIRAHMRELEISANRTTNPGALTSDPTTETESTLESETAKQTHTTIAAPAQLTKPSTAIPRRRSRSATEAATPVVGPIGSPAHVNYMKETYDQMENQRRNYTVTNINHKLQYTAEKLQQDQVTNFNRVFDQVCHIQNRQLSTWWALLQINPTIGMRTILRRNDIVAFFVGRNVLNVNQCRSITPTQIYRDHRVNDTCYIYMPIRTAQNQMMFVIAGSHDVMETSPAINCAEVNPTIWEEEEGTWKGPDGNANVTTLPGFGQNTPVSLQRLNFRAGDMYEPAKGSSFPLMLAISYGASLQSLQQNHQTLIRVLSGKGILDGNFQHIMESSGYVIDAASSAISSTMDAFAWLFSWQLIAIGIALLIIVILVIVGIFVLKGKILMGTLGTVMPTAKNLLNINNVDIDEITMEEVPQKQQLQPLAPTTRPHREVNYTITEEPRHRPIRRSNYPPLFTYIPILIAIVCVASTNASRLPHTPATMENTGTTVLWDSGLLTAYIRASVLDHFTRCTKKSSCCIERYQPKTPGGGNIDYRNQSHSDADVLFKTVKPAKTAKVAKTAKTAKEDRGPKEDNNFNCRSARTEPGGQ